jgi:hypothetical protein
MIQTVMLMYILLMITRLIHPESDDSTVTYTSFPTIIMITIIMADGPTITARAIIIHIMIICGMYTTALGDGADGTDLTITDTITDRIIMTDGTITVRIITEVTGTAIMTVIMIPITTEDEDIHLITGPHRIITHTVTDTEQTVLTERPLTGIMLQDTRLQITIALI